MLNKTIILDYFINTIVQHDSGLTEKNQTIAVQQLPRLCTFYAIYSLAWKPDS